CVADDVRVPEVEVRAVPALQRRPELLPAGRGVDAGEIRGLDRRLGRRPAQGVGPGDPALDAGRVGDADQVRVEQRAVPGLLDLEDDVVAVADRDGLGPDGEWLPGPPVLD